MIKVLVSGAFSTGKTTLCAALAETLRQDGFRVVVVMDVARRRPLPLNRQQTEESTLWLLARQVVAEIEASEGTVDVVLCDRGIPDVLAHLLEGARRLAPSLILQSIVPFAEAWLQTYDLILATQVDSGRPPISDGLREADVDYRETMAAWADRTLLRGQNIKRLDPQANPSDQARAAAEAVRRCLTI